MMAAATAMILGGMLMMISPLIGGAARVAGSFFGIGAALRSAYGPLQPPRADLTALTRKLDDTL